MRSITESLHDRLISLLNAKDSKVSRRADMAYAKRLVQEFEEVVRALEAIPCTDERMEQLNNEYARAKRMLLGYISMLRDAAYA